MVQVSAMSSSDAARLTALVYAREDFSEGENESEPATLTAVMQDNHSRDILGTTQSSSREQTGQSLTS